MPRRVDVDDDWEGEDDDWVSNEDDGWCCAGDEDDDPTTECPHCHKPVFDQAERCPHCGWYISEEDTPPNRLPGFIVLGLTLAAVAVYFWVTH
jgi:hypothetical protein